MRRYLVLLAVAVVAVSTAYAYRSWPWLFRKVEPSATFTKVLFDGNKVLDPSLGPTRIRVFQITKYSTGPGDANDFWMNRIEADTNGQVDILSWDGFAGDRTDFRDLDNDGVLEILVYLGEHCVRVVSLVKGKLRFRSQDDALGALKDPQPADINSDGTPEFTFVVPFPKEGAEGGILVPMPHLASWSRESGFKDVTPRFRNHLKTRLLPELKSRLEAEGDVKRLALFEQALASYE